MEKILSLSSKDFVTGIAQGAHSTNTGLWHKANGIFPFNGRLSNENVNIYTLMAGDGGAAVATITGSIIASVNDPENVDTYYMDDDGSIYQNTSSVITGLTTPGKGGLAIFQPRSGTKYLYYWHNTQIGRYGDLDGSPTATSNWATGLTSTALRPVHTLFDVVYYGNGDKIGSISDQSGTATNNSNVLDFPSEFTVVDITDDGFYLVAGITNAVTGNFGVNKVIFWNQLDPSWNKEWIIPDDYITNVESVGGIIYIIGKTTLWRCTFNSPPEPVRFIRRPVQGYPNASLSYQGLLLWGDIDGRVNSYGKWSPDAPRAFFKPFDMGTSAGVSALGIHTTTFSGKSLALVVSTLDNDDTNKAFNLFGEVTTPGTGVAAETVYFTPEISNFVQIKRIDVTFAEPMASGDSVNIDVQEDEDTAAVDFGTAAFATQGAKKKVKLSKNLGNMEQFKLIVNLNGGAPKIKRIDVYGETAQND